MKLFGCWYKLVDKKVVPCAVNEMPDFSMKARRVALTVINTDIRVSTVFLGIDHSWNDDDVPLFFETMVFGGVLDGLMHRYSTWSEAKQGHAIILKRTKRTRTKWKLQQIRTRNKRLINSCFLTTA